MNAPVADDDNIFGSPFITWRGIPLVPSGKVKIENGKTKILLLRTGQADSLSFLTGEALPSPDPVRQPFLHRASVRPARRRPGVWRAMTCAAIARIFRSCRTWSITPISCPGCV